MKKAIAILLALTVVFALAASCCSKEETAKNEITTAESTAAVKETPVREETTISWEEAAILRAQKLVATKEDFEALEKTALKVLRCTPDKFRGYDSSSDLAFQDAMYMIYNSRLHLGHGISGKEPEFESFGEYDKDAGKYVFEPDPLNMFSDVEDAAGYIRINAGYVEWVLENILCTKPDRTKTSDDFDYSAYPNAEEFYYHDGYYYYSTHEGGGGGGPIQTIGYTYNRDGSYTVRFTSFDRDRDDEYDVEHGLYTGYAITEANAILKDVDGERVWSISYIKIIENMDQEQ